MPELKIAVEIASLGMPLKKALHVAAELGAGAVEIDARGEITPRLSRTGLRQLRKMLDDLRLRVGSIRFRTRRGYATMADLDARVTATKSAMEFARDLGASLVVNHVGLIPAELDSPVGRLLVEVLVDLGEHGHRVGALLAVEAGTGGIEPLARLLTELPDATLAIDLNPGALVQNGFSPLEAVDALGPTIQLVHATDAHAGLAARPGEPARLSQGEVDFPALLGSLEEHGYRGRFVVGRQTLGNAQEEIAAAVQYLRSM